MRGKRWSEWFHENSHRMVENSMDSGDDSVIDNVRSEKCSVRIVEEKVRSIFIGSAL